MRTVILLGFLILAEKVGTIAAHPQGLDDTVKNYLAIVLTVSMVMDVMEFVHRLLKGDK